MRNRFAGDCYKCGLRVAAGAGHFERHNGGWRVQHGLHPGDDRVTCEEADEALITEQEKNAGRYEDGCAAAGFDPLEYFD